MQNASHEQSSRRYQFVVGNKVLLAEQRTNKPFMSSRCVATDKGHVCLWHNMEGVLIEYYMEI